MKKKNVCLIGHLGLGKESHNGQTISTCLWLENIKNMDIVKRVYEVDITNYKSRFFAISFSLLLGLSRCSHIIIMFSKNGMLRFVPILYRLNRLFHKKIYQRVIGGGTDFFLEQHINLVKYFNSFEVTWVQSHRIVEGLKKIGVAKVEYLDNFRNNKPLLFEQLPKKAINQFKFCIFCRVTKTKGITTAIRAINELCAACPSVEIVLDIYGPLDDDYYDEFHALIDSTNNIHYYGSVPHEMAQGILKDYLVMDPI